MRVLMVLLSTNSNWWIDWRPLESLSIHNMLRLSGSQTPTPGKSKPEEAARLAGEFETLFSTITGYDALDERIAKTRTKKGCLLMVLTHPEIPLHNNPAELGARARVRKRDVSFGPRTREGATAWDTFMTLAETATKLGVNCLTLKDWLRGVDPPQRCLLARLAGFLRRVGYL